MKSKHVRIVSDLRKPVAGELRNKCIDALEEFAEFGLDETNKITPLEEGTLIGSGAVEVDREKGRAQISYDTAYARKQHEDTTLKHDQGREAKFLEKTLNRIGPQMGPFIASRVRLK